MPVKARGYIVIEDVRTDLFSSEDVLRAIDDLKKYYDWLTSFPLHPQPDTNPLDKTSFKKNATTPPKKRKKQPNPSPGRRMIDYLMRALAALGGEASITEAMEKMLEDGLQTYAALKNIPLMLQFNARRYPYWVRYINGRLLLTDDGRRALETLPPPEITEKKQK